MTPEITLIPLNQLQRSTKNIRRIAAGGTTELAASILRDGLIQNLTVTCTEDGQYEVVAGDRRLRALQLLASQGNITEEHPVPCNVVAAEDATAISLAENQLREPMHPVDQLEAFTARIDAGETVTDVAARFGVTETFVKQRLKLASVAPALLEECRQNRMTLQQLQAFSVTTDHDRQIEYWGRIKDSRNHAASPDWIKEELLEDAIDSDDYRLKFIGRAAYLKAGGAIIAPDEFAEPDDDNDGPAEVLTDPELLEQLAQQKLEKQAAKLKKAESLAFVEVFTKPFYPHLHTHVVRATVVEREPSPELQQTIQQLEEEIEEICQKRDEAEEDDEQDQYDQLCAQEETLTEKLEQILESLREPHPDEVEHVGAVISLSRSGKAEVTRNLIRAEHKAKVTASPRQQTTGHDSADDSDHSEEPLAFSERLTQQLLTQKTAILRNEMLQRPDDCLAVMAYQMIVEDYGRALGRTMTSYVLRANKDWQMQPLEATDPTITTADALKEFTAEEEELLADISAILSELPEDANPEPALLDYLLNVAPRDKLIKLIALGVANRIDLRGSKTGREETADRLIVPRFLTHLQVTTYWSATADNFFNHISKALIIDVVSEARGATVGASLASLNKKDAALQAEQLIAGEGWLPAPMCISNSEEG